MAEVNHRYIGRIPSESEQERQTKRDQLDAEWRRKRIDAESARQRLHEAKMLEMKRVLVPRQSRHATGGVSHHPACAQRLLALPALEACEMSSRLGAIRERSEQKLSSKMRAALETRSRRCLLRVSDPDWLGENRRARTNVVEAPAARYEIGRIARPILCRHDLASLCSEVQNRTSSLRSALVDCAAIERDCEACSASFCGVSRP